MESYGCEKTIISSGINAFEIKASKVTIQNLSLKSNGGGVALALQSGISDIRLNNLTIDGS